MEREQQLSFLEIAIQRPVRRRALRIAIIVGCVIAMINHGDHLLNMTLQRAEVLKIVVTFLVPYCVSTYSSVQAIRDRTESI